jgi:hypothetical protein
MAWNDRFKMASAQKRREKEAAAQEAQGYPAPAVAGPTSGITKAPIYTDSEIARARQCDPRPFLQGRGYEIEVDCKNRYFAVMGGSKEYRISSTPGGWLWCTVCGTEGGNTIDLVRAIDRCDFPTAMRTLMGGPMRQTARPTSDITAKALTLPPPGGEVEGRAYLRGRGISSAAIEKAESQGVLRYAEGAVFFCGYDRHGQIRAVTRRGYIQGDPSPKRDLAGSQKMCAPIIRGGPEVWIVEGGASALALLDYAPRVLGLPVVPTIIVSGGAGVRSWIDQAHIQGLLRAAPHITIAGEREKDADTQMRTDALRQAQARAIFEAVGKMPEMWMPPEGCKDVAEANRPPAPKPPKSSVRPPRM